MNNLIEMNYNGNEIRTIDDNGQVWWMLSDVCKVLDLSTPSKVSDRLDDDEKGMTLIHTLGGKQNVTIVNESGLYSVILRSDKPEAKPFRRWITHEVLPELRRTGSYSLVKKERVKTWYGVPVLTVADIAERMGIARDTARHRIFTHLRNGLDYFLISGYSLRLFKFENGSVPGTTAQMILVRQDAFEEWFNK